MSDYIQTIERLRRSEEGRWGKRYPATPSMFHPMAQIHIGAFRAYLSSMFATDNMYLLTVKENSIGRSYLYVRDIEARLVGKALLPKDRWDEYTAFYLRYWIPESAQRKILEPDKSMQVTEYTDLELLQEYNRRNPVKAAINKDSAEIIDLIEYFEETKNRGKV